MLRRNSQGGFQGEFSDPSVPKRRATMVAVTYDLARVSAGETVERTEAAAPRKSWFARLVDAMIEARRQQARREIAMHTQLLPFTCDERGNRLVKTQIGDMPFGGW
jgi:hypothetical protein